MEDLIKKVSYLKGYADGLDLSPKSDEGKLIIKLLDVMSEMADTIEELNSRVDDVEDVVDELDDCGLAAAALSGEQDKFPRFHRKGAVPKAWRLLALISIGHMVKANHGSTPLQQIPPTQRAKNSSVTTTSWM